jgi:D-alanyl-D-alanine carboxypeptidase (penicillin-binding protein 5/6)
MEEVRKKQNIIPITAVNIFALFFAGVYAFPLFFYQPEPIALPVIVPVLPDPFVSVSLNAEAVYVYDTVTGKTLFSKNEEAQLPLASVTKVMTALVASGVPENTRVSVSLEDVANGPGGLSVGEKWNLKNLLDYTLVISSNSGASAIAGAIGAVLQNENGWKGGSEEVFVEKMNETAKDLRMEQTFYLNPSGLDENTELSGAYGSAKDMAILFDYILKTAPSLLSATTHNSLKFDSIDGVSHLAVNTNTITQTVPGLMASKTGYTDLANGNLVIAFDVGPMHPVIIAVLGSTQEGRFTDIEKLVNATIEKIGQGE